MTYIQSRINNFIAVDYIRMLRLLEITQYTILYSIITLILAPRIDKLFPSFDETKSSVQLFKEVVFQLMFVSFVIFYMRKFVKIIPPLGHLLIKGYRIGTTVEYNGGIIIGLILVHSQFHINAKIYELMKRIEKI